MAHTCIGRDVQYQLKLSDLHRIYKLIQLYRANECLWNPSCRKYYSCLETNRAWHRIATLMGGNISVIKQMIYALRDYYDLETKYLNLCQKRFGVRHLPTHLYYYELEFLSKIKMQPNSKIHEPQTPKDNLAGNKPLLFKNNNNKDTALSAKSSKNKFYNKKSFVLVIDSNSKIGTPNLANVKKQEKELNNSSKISKKFKGFKKYLTKLMQKFTRKFVHKTESFASNKSRNNEQSQFDNISVKLKSHEAIQGNSGTGSQYNSLPSLKKSSSKVMPKTIFKRKVKKRFKKKRAKKPKNMKVKSCCCLAKSFKRNSKQKRKRKTKLPKEFIAINKLLKKLLRSMKENGVSNKFNENSPSTSLAAAINTNLSSKSSITKIFQRTLFNTSQTDWLAEKNFYTRRLLSQRLSTEAPPVVGSNNSELKSEQNVEN